MKEETFTGLHGTALHLRSWCPESAQAVVILVHGLNSHSGQYLWTAEQLRAAGFAVYAHDHRGRGKSEGRRFYIDDISEYTRDLGAVISLAKSRHPGLKVFVLGHSMGGVVGCVWAFDHQAEIAGFICESFAYRVPVPGAVAAVLRVIGRIAPGLPVFKLQMKDFTRDPQALAALEADALCRGEIQPARTAAALLAATANMKARFPSVTLPLLLLHGTKDHATLPAGTQEFFALAGSADKTLKLYEGHYHDLLNDLGKQQVMDDILAWLRARH